jgi:hypothetical protein
MINSFARSFNGTRINNTAGDGLFRGLVTVIIRIPHHPDPFAASRNG